MSLWQEIEQETARIPAPLFLEFDYDYKDKSWIVWQNSSEVTAHRSANQHLTFTK